MNTKKLLKATWTVIGVAHVFDAIMCTLKIALASGSLGWNITSLILSVFVAYLSYTIVFEKKLPKLKIDFGISFKKGGK